jgi:outer membrane receptor protein involved in Fe transport
MSTFRLHALASALALAFPLTLRAADAPAADPPAAAPPATVIEVTGTRQRLDAARNGLSPDTGSTIYRLDRQDIANLPRGDATPLNQVILQTPGVAQDSFGQLHVRGDHANVQYRINGVIIPESISGFGQALETRFAERINILTGALPAQYGYRNAAVVDIQSKGETDSHESNVGLTFGGHGHREASADTSGAAGAFSWYVNGSLLRDRLGIENPTPAREALHDSTQQGKLFGTVSWLLNDAHRLSLMFGSTDNRFEIPNRPGQTPDYTLDGAAPADSARLDARQRERNRFGVVSWQGSAGTDIDWQVSLFTRSTDVHYQPDAVGDLQYFGIAADVLRRNQAHGTQADLSWRLDKAHTMRAGFFGQRETFTSANHAAVFPADAGGDQTSGVPLLIQDDSRIAGSLWGAYLQDEWKPTQALTLNYGARYDRARTVIDEGQLSPRLGLVFDLSATLRLHAGYASYFTPPTTEKIDTTTVQKFLGTTNALPSDANTAVRAERSDYYAAGLAWQATPALTLGVDAYYRRVRHLQDEGQFGNALIFSAFNYERGLIQGLEFSANYRARAFSGYLNLGLTKARGRGIESGQFNFDADELAYIANHWVHLDHEQRLSASAGASYRFDGDLTLSTDALFGSGLRNGFANTEHLPGYTTVNLALAKKFDFGPGLGKLDTRLALVNLFDRIYQLRDGTGIGAGAPQFGMRRTLYVSVNKAF